MEYSQCRLAILPLSNDQSSHLFQCHQVRGVNLSLVRPVALLQVQVHQLQQKAEETELVLLLNLQQLWSLQQFLAELQLHFYRYHDQPLSELVMRFVDSDVLRVKPVQMDFQLYWYNLRL